MTPISFQFCPSCGKYWSPRNQSEAREVGTQTCPGCGTRVRYSWLGYILLGLLLGLLLYTSTIPVLKTAAAWVLLILLVIAFFRGLQQFRASRR